MVEHRITEYLANGGLFNPEAMEHDKVLDLLIACRDELAALSAQVEELKREARRLETLAMTLEAEAGNSKARAEAAESALAAKEAEAKKLERERDHYKRLTRNCIGFTDETTGQRITIYAEHSGCLDAWLTDTPAVQEVRYAHAQVRSGKAKSMNFGDESPRAALSGEDGQ